jgi:uncharacterized protein (DUF2235 family)
MAKFIIFCADGTWNRPDQDENEDRQPDPTNVYKLFSGLAGTMCVDSIRDADEQEKELRENNQILQIAKYIHGVGDSRHPIIKLMGGAFGAGIISRIVRGYTFISRHYEAGDRIVVVGFSRGAYTARALAGLIASQGLLAKPLTVDKPKAYRWGTKAWYLYRKQSNSNKAGILQRLAEAVADLPAFLSNDEIQDSDLVAVETIKAVAVWDTVGAMGLPRYMNDSRTDAFRFTDTRLSPKVEHGFHAMALDEKRTDFTPTLWDAADNVIQMVFPGAHADVGGGYPTQNNESGLSDIALEWMVEQLKTVGVRFGQPIYTPFAPNAKGVAHKPWQHPPFNVSGKAKPRNLKGSGIPEHPSIQARMKAGPVVAEPGESPAPYAPTNRP